tara:strand:+ start:7011 stop:8198 length:1188 start_codon:yes stop_codon:yes gene_type:complete
MICFVLSSHAFGDDLKPTDLKPTDEQDKQVEQSPAIGQSHGSDTTLSDCEEAYNNEVTEPTSETGSGKVGYFLVFATSIFTLSLALFGVMHEEKYRSNTSSRSNLLELNSKGYLIVIVSVLLVVVGFSFQLMEMLDQQNQLEIAQKDRDEKKRELRLVECKLTALRDSYDKNSIRSNLGQFIEIKNELNSLIPNLEGHIEHIFLIGKTPRFPEGYHQSNFLAKDFQQMVAYLVNSDDAIHVKKLVLNTDHLTSIAGIQSLENLEHLQLSVMKNIEDTELSDLAGLKNLKVLSIYETNLTGECLSFIPDDNKIEKLVFSNSKFNLASLEHLKKLKHLKELNLYHNNFKIDKSNFDQLSDAILELEELDPLTITTGIGTVIGKEHLQKIKDLRAEKK